MATCSEYWGRRPFSASAYQRYQRRNSVDLYLPQASQHSFDVKNRPDSSKQRKKEDPLLPDYVKDFLYDPYHPKVAVAPKISSKQAIKPKIKTQRPKKHVRSLSKTPLVKTNEQTKPLYKPRVIRITPRATVTLFTKDEVPELLPTKPKVVPWRKIEIPSFHTTFDDDDNTQEDFDDIIQQEAALPPAYTFGAVLWKMSQITAASQFV